VPGVAARKPDASAVRSGEGICSDHTGQQKRGGHGSKAASAKSACKGVWAKIVEIRFAEVLSHLMVSIRLQPAMITIGR
jgi:hypothetical protein